MHTGFAVCGVSTVRVSGRVLICNTLWGTVPLKSSVLRGNEVGEREASTAHTIFAQCCEECYEAAEREASTARAMWYPRQKPKRKCIAYQVRTGDLECVRLT